MAIDSRFFAFWRDSKKHGFLIRFKWPKKSDKSDQQAAQGPRRRERGTTLWEPGPQSRAFLARAGY